MDAEESDPMATSFIHQLGGIFREQVQDHPDPLLPTAAWMVMNFRVTLWLLLSARNGFCLLLMC